MQNWHLLMTKPREDDRAEQHLRNQHYEIFRPRIRHFRLCRGKQTKALESMFPRYIFIRLDEEFSNWAALRSTRGVAGFVRFSEYPAIVPPALVAQLMAHVDPEHILDQTVSDPDLFHAGDRVRIDGGSFNGLQAIVKAQSSEERVVVLLDMLGRTQALELPIAQVRAAF